MAKFFSLYAFIGVLLLVLVKGNPICPGAEVIAPCTCKVVAYGYHVVCAFLKSSEEIEAKFKVLSTYHVDNLLLHAVNFSKDYEKPLFHGMNVNALQIEKSTIMINKNAFEGLVHSLQTLNVMDCSIFGSTIELAKLDKLVSIRIEKNKLDKIPTAWLKDKAPNIKSISLDKNDIAVIEESAFAYFEYLKEISLADNRISSVTRNMFPRPANKLTRIDLSHNELRHLPTDIFTKMHNLETVVLSGNDLSSIPQATWSEIWKRINAVLLYENSIICDERVKWIKDRKKPEMLEGTCAEPSAVKGQLLKNVL